MEALPVGPAVTNLPIYTRLPNIGSFVSPIDTNLPLSARSRAIVRFRIGPGRTPPAGTEPRYEPHEK